MSDLSLGVGATALFIGLVGFVRAASAQRQAAKASLAASDDRRRASNTEEALRNEIEILRSHLARVASGEAVTADMIREGLLWRDVEADEARRLIDEDALVVIDVRTPEEVAAGRLPGSRHIPMDEVEARMDEIPKDRDVLVYCAGGGRSAAICEALSERGWERLLNLDGGIGAWNGPVERE